MDYYNEIKDKLIKNDLSKKVREYYSNRNDLTTYYDVGKLLSDAGKHYGDGIIKEYSIRLIKDIGKKYDSSSLKRMRQFYIITLKGAPLAHQLSWSHYQELLPIKDIDEIKYYIDISIEYNLSRNKLREKIRNKEYQRLDKKTKEKINNQIKLDIGDSIKEPIILKSKKNYEKISEYALKEIIMNDLDNFLSELGDGFCYVSNEYKIRIGEVFNYIDILLSNTIGIIVCRKNNQFIIKYSSDLRIHAVTYEIV